MGPFLGPLVRNCGARSFAFLGPAGSRFGRPLARTCQAADSRVLGAGMTPKCMRKQLLDATLRIATSLARITTAWRSHYQARSWTHVDHCPRPEGARKPKGRKEPRSRGAQGTQGPEEPGRPMDFEKPRQPREPMGPREAMTPKPPKDP